MERSAEMTPLPQYSIPRNWTTEGMEEMPSASAHVPLHESTPIPSQYTPSIHKLELKQSSSPSIPKYYQPSDGAEKSESWSNSGNTEAPPLPPPRDYSITDLQPHRQERSYRGPKPTMPDFTCDDPR